MTTRRRETSPGDLPHDDRPLLPHSLEAERAVLGAILIDNTQYDHLASWVDDGFFYRDAHSRIWEAMVTLADQSKRIDLVTLKNELVRTSELDACGGPAYVAQLTDGIPRAANVSHYAQILKDLKTKRSLTHFARRIIDAVRSGEQSPTDILSNADAALLGMIGHHETRRIVSMEQAVNDHFKTMEWRVEHRGELIGLETGFPQINENTFGWMRGDLTIVAARPSMGKSAFLMNSILASAKTGSRWAVFSLEMKRAQLMDRMVAVESAIPLTRIMNGYIAEAEYARMSTALSLIVGLPLHLDDSTRLTTSNIRRTCRRLKLEGGLDGVAVDYIQLLAATKEQRGENRTQQLDDISRELKGIADEMNVAMLVLSQLSRPTKGSDAYRPVMSDLRQSGGLEQNADVVAFLHRESHKHGGPTEFILDKQRMGPTGTVMLTFDRDLTKFEDAPQERVPELPVADTRPRRRKNTSRPLLPSNAVSGF